MSDEDSERRDGWKVYETSTNLLQNGTARQIGGAIGGIAIAGIVGAGRALRQFVEACAEEDKRTAYQNRQCIGKPNRSKTLQWNGSAWVPYFSEECERAYWERLNKSLAAEAGNK